MTAIGFVHILQGALKILQGGKAKPKLTNWSNKNFEEKSE
jgi:hypothetical protein